MVFVQHYSTLPMNRSSRVASAGITENLEGGGEITIFAILDVFDVFRLPCTRL